MHRVVWYVAFASISTHCLSGDCSIRVAPCLNEFFRSSLIHIDSLRSNYELLAASYCCANRASLWRCIKNDVGSYRLPKASCVVILITKNLIVSLPRACHDCPPVTKKEYTSLQANRDLLSTMGRLVVLQEKAVQSFYGLKIGASGTQPGVDHYS